jgi:FkbM family methyltransferase
VKSSLAPDQSSQTVDLEGLRLEVLADNQDAAWYLQRKTFEEKASLLYRFIRDEGYANFVDVGANVGFVSIVAHRLAPRLKVFAFEADPRLAGLISRNFLAHGMASADVYNAIVGSSDAAATEFSLNPNSTLDNRVSMRDWPKTLVRMVAIDTALLSVLSGKTFFKIDTQGFELNVLRGMERTLSRLQEWILKMEFAPKWLTSQGTAPEAVLEHLQARYEFAEYPERISFGARGIDTLFASLIRPDQHGAFVQHVRSLNRSGLGWVDLIVRPKRARSAVPPEH